MCTGDSPGKITGTGFHGLLQGIFPTQGSNPGLPHCSRSLYRLSHQGIPESQKCQKGPRAPTFTGVCWGKGLSGNPGICLLGCGRKGPGAPAVGGATPA